MKKTIIKSLSLIGLLSVLGMCGCQSSVSIIQTNLNDMVEIVEANKSDCNAVGTKLNEYMDKHEATLTKMISYKNNATEEEAKLLYETSLRLHNLLKVCQTNEIERFKGRLSDSIIQKAIPEKKQ